MAIYTRVQRCVMIHLISLGMSAGLSRAMVVAIAGLSGIIIGETLAMSKYIYLASYILFSCAVGWSLYDGDYAIAIANGVAATAMWIGFMAELHIERVGGLPRRMIH